MSYNSSQNEDVTRTRIDNVFGPQKFRIKKVRNKKYYAETDLDKGTIKIDKQRHKTNPIHKKRYPELADTIYHEALHVKHPKMTEKQVRKVTRKKLKKMNRKQKSRIYNTNTITKFTNFDRK